MRRLLLLSWAMATGIVSGPALAGRGHGHGHAIGFAWSTCRTDSCLAKHPSGRYLHPLTGRTARRHR